MKQRAQSYARSSEMYEQMIKRYEDQVAKLKAKSEEEVTDADKVMIERLEKSIVSLKQSAQRMKEYAERNPYKEPTEEQIQAQLESMVKSKMAIASISATEEDVFVACRALVGYGFEVWRTDASFENGEKIVQVAAAEGSGTDHVVARFHEPPHFQQLQAWRERVVAQPRALAEQRYGNTVVQPQAVHH